MSEYITTYTGEHFRPLEPDPQLIKIEDIAHETQRRSTKV